MIYLEKEIEKIVLIDLFKQEERDRDNQFIVSQPLKDYLDEKGQDVDIYFPSDQASFIDILIDLSNQVGNGLILQISGHGDRGKTGFGNDLDNYWTLWENVLTHFAAINRAWNGGLIINASMICYSDGLVDKASLNYRPYHAAITSCDQRSSQGFLQNKRWFESSFNGRNTIQTIMETNNGIEAYVDYKPYKVDMHRIYS